MHLRFFLPHTKTPSTRTTSRAKKMLCLHCMRNALSAPGKLITSRIRHGNTIQQTLSHRYISTPHCNITHNHSLAHHHPQQQTVEHPLTPPISTHTRITTSAPGGRPHTHPSRSILITTSVTPTTANTRRETRHVQSQSSDSKAETWLSVKIEESDGEGDFETAEVEGEEYFESLGRWLLAFRIADGGEAVSEDASWLRFWGDMSRHFVEREGSEACVK